MKIYILGHKGMLGRYVSSYLGKYYEIKNLSRNEIDASNINEEQLEHKLKNFGISEGDVVINCIGTIKPMVDSLGDSNAIKVNSLFPRILADLCERINVNMIHPTTDCVYSGNKGNYIESDNYDVYDVYGMSKALGEPKNCTVIRTSIIGEEVNQKRSLVEWVKSQKNNTVFGFTNHYWNGVTCLQFAKICKKIIDNHLFWKGTKHIYSNILNKKQLVELISKIYELNINVIPKETDSMCDRTLSSVENIHLFEIPELEQQVIDMKNYHSELINL